LIYIDIFFYYRPLFADLKGRYDIIVSVQ